MARLTENGEDLRQIDLAGGFAVIVPERGLDLLPPRKEGVVELADFGNPLSRRRPPHGLTVGLLERVKPVDLGHGLGDGETRLGGGRHEVSLS